MKYVNPRTLVRAGTAIRLGDTMFLRERVRTPLIARSDSPHHGIRMVLDRINKRDGCGARSAEDTKSQGRLSGRLRSGRVEGLHAAAHSNEIEQYLAKYMGDTKLEERTRCVRGIVALRIRRVRS
jgi:hypothetical protein